ncbi:substrate-binding periplasmic protein [Pseudomonadota bacterium]
MLAENNGLPKCYKNLFSHPNLVLHRILTYHFLEKVMKVREVVMRGEKLSIRSFVGLILSALFFTTLSAASSAAEKEVVHFCFLNWGKQGGENLPEKGFNPDLVSTILREAGYQPKVTILPWVRCVEQTKQQKFDFIAGYWKGGEGDTYFDYFHPTTIDRINFIALESSGLTSGRLEDLYGKKIGHLRGAGGLETFRAQIDRFTVHEATDDIALIKMLEGGRIDAILSNSPHIASLAEASYPHLVDKLLTLQPPIQVNIAAPAIAWGHPKREEMKQRYNAAYEKLVAQGIYERLMAKHKIRVDYE